MAMEDWWLPPAYSFLTHTGLVRELAPAVPAEEPPANPAEAVPTTGVSAEQSICSGAPKAPCVDGMSVLP